MHTRVSTQISRQTRARDRHASAGSMWCLRQLLLLMLIAFGLIVDWACAAGGDGDVSGGRLVFLRKVRDLRSAGYCFQHASIRLETVNNGVQIITGTHPVHSLVRLISTVDFPFFEGDRQLMLLCCCCCYCCCLLLLVCETRNSTIVEECWHPCGQNITHEISSNMIGDCWGTGEMSARTFSNRQASSDVCRLCQPHPSILTTATSENYVCPPLTFTNHR